VGAILDELGLELHPKKTKKVELTDGLAGFDFLGFHLHKRMSGRVWEQYGRRRYYLHRWPSKNTMKRARRAIKARIGPHRNGVRDIRVLIRDLNPFLRGWGAYFGTGIAAKKFNQLDSFVWRRLVDFLARRKGRHLKAGEWLKWTRAFSWDLRLYRLRRTVRYLRAV
jgi:hypothetical protein